MFEHESPKDQRAEFTDEDRAESVDTAPDAESDYDVITSDGGEEDYAPDVLVPGQLEISDRIEPSIKTADTDETAETLFDVPDRRPTAKRIAKLIHEGMTESDIIAIGEAAGFEPPSMNRSLRDLETVMPYIARTADTMSDWQDEHTIVAYAARDGELFQDDHAITHPEDGTVLMPASMYLMDSQAMGDPEIVRRFYAEHGADENWIQDQRSNLTIVDTGFVGNVALRARSHLESAYGLTRQEAIQRVTPLLFCSMSRHASSIFDVTTDPRSFRLPKVNANIGQYNDFLDSGKPNSFRLAVALQIMPRFHGHFDSIVRLANGGLKATVRSEPLQHNVDRIAVTDRTVMNTAPINPVAATVVQYRVVRNALQRTGQL